MSRREEVDAKLLHTALSDWPSADEAAEYRHLSLTLADEVDERDAVITKLLAMLRDSGVSTCPDCNGIGGRFVQGTAPRNVVQHESGYVVACESCGGHEDSRGYGYIIDGNCELHARACEIAGREE